MVTVPSPEGVAPESRTKKKEQETSPAITRNSVTVGIKNFDFISNLNF
jgi:hypothetical protein